MLLFDSWTKTYYCQKFNSKKLFFLAVILLMSLGIFTQQIVVLFNEGKKVKSTSAHFRRNLLIIDNYNGKIIVFATKRLLQLLAIYKNIFMDGNLKKCIKQFH